MRGLLENQGFFRLSLLYRNGTPIKIQYQIMRRNIKKIAEISV